MTLRAKANVVQPHEGLSLDLGYTRLRVLLSGDDTDGAFALTEQPLEAGALAGPLHTHANENGFIYVLVGRIGAQVGDDTVEVAQRGVILVPRGVKHTFWNPTAQGAAVLEVFSPAGLERWFQELAQLVAAKEPDIQAIVASADRHGTDLDLESLPGLLERHGLHLPGL
jgi:quercetin dioxygenase-like cupin family protein